MHKHFLILVHLSISLSLFLCICHCILTVNNLLLYLSHTCKSSGRRCRPRTLRRLKFPDAPPSLWSLELCSTGIWWSSNTQPSRVFHGQLVSVYVRGSCLIMTESLLGSVAGQVQWLLGRDAPIVCLQTQLVVTQSGLVKHRQPLHRVRRQRLKKHTGNLIKLR